MFSHGKETNCYLVFVTADRHENVIAMFENYTELYTYLYPGKPFDRNKRKDLTSKVCHSLDCADHITWLLGYKAKMCLVPADDDDEETMHIEL